MPETLVYIGIAVGLIQTLAILGGGILVSFRLGRGTQRVESAILLQKELFKQAQLSIVELKNEVTALKTLMTEVALQKVAIEQLRQWYDELRHGEGYIHPLRSRPVKTTG